MGRRIALTLTGALLLPLGLLLAAFLSGGFRESTYSLLAAAVWLGLGVARWRRPSGPALALLGLGCWTLLSGLWGAPGPAFRVAPLVLLYAGAVVAAEPWIRGGCSRGSGPHVPSWSARASPPARPAAGFALASGEGSQRLDWPVGYANGLGLVAVFSALLAAGLEWRRGRLALASASLAGAACLLTYSRTALLAGAVAAVLMLALRPSAARGLAAALVGVAAIGLLGLAGPTTGPRLLPVLVLAAAAGAALPPLSLRVSRRALVLGAFPLVLAALLLARPFAERVAEPSPDARNASRLVDLSGHGRTALWHSAWREGAAHPLAGGGAGTWPRAYAAQTGSLSGPANAHSLELETFAELGVVGLALLLAFLALSGRAALAAKAEPWAPAALGVIAAWALVSAADWDWQLPAATLPAMLAVGALAGARRAPPLRLGTLACAGALVVGLACALARPRRRPGRERRASTRTCPARLAPAPGRRTPLGGSGAQQGLLDRPGRAHAAPDGWLARGMRPRPLSDDTGSGMRLRLVFALLAVSVVVSIGAVVALAAPGAVAGAASPNASAAKTEYCPAGEADRRKAVLRRFVRHMKANRRVLPDAPQPQGPGALREEAAPAAVTRSSARPPPATEPRGRPLGFGRCRSPPRKTSTPSSAPRLRTSRPRSARASGTGDGAAARAPDEAYAEEKMALLERLGHASSKAEEGGREPRSRPGWKEIPSSAPGTTPLPRGR